LSETTHSPNTANTTRSASRGAVLTVVVIALLVAVLLAIFGILERKNTSAELATYTMANAAPTVSLVQPRLEKSAHEIVLPGNMQAYTLAPIYARTAGYVKSWSHDIGAHVRKGDLLAVIEAPEVDQQLAQARADLATAQSNADLALVTAKRYQDLLKQNAVSQQDTDNQVAQLEARNAQVSSAQANVRRLQELVSFERVTAPFDGVITARNLDVGQLVTAAGSTTTQGTGLVANAKPMFEISSIQKLRVFISVPQVYSSDARTGVTATLTLPQFPGRTFKGTLVRKSDAVDPVTRTMVAEIEVDNSKGELFPGSYTQVHLNVSRETPAMVVPVSALMLLPEGLRVAVVDAQSRAHLVAVTPGRDSGATMQILSGIDPGQKIIDNPPDSLSEGDLVRVVQSARGAGGAGGQQRQRASDDSEEPTSPSGQSGAAATPRQSQASGHSGAPPVHSGVGSGQSRGQGTRP
jgi:RND family efflux transporter MFP subunit